MPAPWFGAPDTLGFVKLFREFANRSPTVRIRPWIMKGRRVFRIWKQQILFSDAVCSTLNNGKSKHRHLPETLSESLPAIPGRRTSRWGPGPTFTGAQWDRIPTPNNGLAVSNRHPRHQCAGRLKMGPVEMRARRRIFPPSLGR